MAFIGHRCSCGHNDINHAEDGKGKRVCTANGGAPCKRRCKTNGEPELMPTFDGKGNRVERIVRPGGGLAIGDAHPIGRTCECESCQSLYGQLATSS